MKRRMNSDFRDLSLFSTAGLFAAVVAAGLLPQVGHAAPRGGDGHDVWNSSNDPHTWQADYEYRFDALPLSGGMTDHTPWSDTYWPSNKAGIAARWSSPGSNGFKYKLLNEQQIRALTPEQMAALSPAEKYDILKGRFDYPTVKVVRSKSSPTAESWTGICHGWSPASLNHAEPAPVTVVSESGISVPFGSADVKALMDQYYADNARANEFLGQRCSRGGSGLNAVIGFFRNAFNPSACEDVNAGALHVILTNELGIRHQGFVADVDRGRQVWNQPVYAFNSRIVGSRGPSEHSGPSTVREVLIHTEMTYADEIEALWSPVVGTSQFAKGVGVYDYSLELDSAGRIVGGEYYLASNRKHPDFMWVAPKLQFTGYYADVMNRIYAPAQQ